jgi:hypothetical protein
MQDLAIETTRHGMIIAYKQISPLAAIYTERKRMAYSRLNAKKLISDLWYILRLDKDCYIETVRQELEYTMRGNQYVFKV